MKRRTTLALAAAALAGPRFAGPAAAQNYPTRPITLFVPWARGGGTDAVARIIGPLLEKELGQPVTVSNQIDEGHHMLPKMYPDGYAIGLITAEISMMHWRGLTQLDYKGFTPIGLVNIDPAAFHVRADSPYRSMKDVLEAIKAAPPGKFMASGTVRGGIWHLALAGMLRHAGIDPASVGWLPSPGGAYPALTYMIGSHLIGGLVDFVTCSLPEARPLIEAGKVRALAIMDGQPAALFPNVPTLKAAIGVDWTVSGWRGLAAPKGLPKDVQAKLVASLKKVCDSKDYKDSMAQRGFDTTWAPGDEFAALMAKADADNGALMKAVGLVK